MITKFYSDSQNKYVLALIGTSWIGYDKLFCGFEMKSESKLLHIKFIRILVPDNNVLLNLELYNTSEISKEPINEIKTFNSKWNKLSSYWSCIHILQTTIEMHWKVFAFCCN